MDAAATFAQAHQLIPGVALTDAQMAQLTSDIVWLVEREVALPDGTTARALVPQVYVRVQPGDLDAGGALLGGDNLDLAVAGDLVNQGGTIAGRTVVALTADNLRNLGGRITGNATRLQALTDLDNIRVRSIIGRFLEHHRVFYFWNGGQEDIYLSSADWMDRNFFRRIETCFPILDDKLKKRVVNEGITPYLKDNLQAWEMQPDGSYKKRTRRGRGYSAQDHLLKLLAAKA